MPERCAPTTAIATSPAAAPRRKRRQRRLRHAHRPERQVGLRVERATEAREQRVLAGGRKERHAERRAVGRDRRRHREAGKIEQIDEVGVGAEIAVEPHRIGLDLGHRVGRRHGRDHQDIDAADIAARAWRAMSASR